MWKNCNGYCLKNLRLKLFLNTINEETHYQKDAPCLHWSLDLSTQGSMLRLNQGYMCWIIQKSCKDSNSHKLHTAIKHTNAFLIISGHEETQKLIKLLKNSSVSKMHLLWWLLGEIGRKIWKVALLLGIWGIFHEICNVFCAFTKSLAKHQRVGSSFQIFLQFFWQFDKVKFTKLT